MNDMFKHKAKVEITYGGKERNIVFIKGLLKKKRRYYVLIDDGAYTVFKNKIVFIIRSECLKIHDACLLMVKAKDTLKMIENGKVVNKLNRCNYARATSQAFKTELITQVHEKAKADLCIRN